ncbi:MAG TPA: TraR/DksA C4-type zinc finger protein [Egibacteraceae bacterium]|nr:TraR/DksA C4-type zinc finger protein [Egibacteraceae bacterium]
MDTDAARSRLVEERDRLASTLASLEDDLEAQKDSLSELSTYDQHPGDIGTETFEREKDESIAESVRASLEDIDHALGKLDDGTYGTCEICKQPIPDARLEALPATRYCVEHQAEMDRAASA